jgi:N-acetylglucosamine malate deacetylase 2
MSCDSALPILLGMAGAALLPQALARQTGPGKLLIVMAHPDDEYECAATTWRLFELGWIADQVTVTDGESRKIPGIRQHYFLDQKDLGFDTDAASAGSGNWDRARVRGFLDDLLARARYDAVFTLLPTAATHGHHRAATVLALEAVAAMPEDIRPLILGVEARAKSDGRATFRGTDPLLVFDRSASFGLHQALDYQTVVNGAIAEHKSQGLFQTEYGESDSEQFWLFEASGPDAVQRAHCGPLGGLL